MSTKKLSKQQMKKQAKLEAKKATVKAVEEQKAEVANAETKTETATTEAPKTEAPKAEAPKEAPKETKTEAPKQEKQKQTKPKTKEKVIEVDAEIVQNEAPIGIDKTNIGGISASLAALADGKIDSNRGIDLMTAIQRQYLVGNPNASPELVNAMSKQFDVMAFIYLIKWNEQTKGDLKEAGVMLNEESFNALTASLGETLGITLKGLPVKDGQMKIDFDQTIDSAPEEIKESLKEEAKTPIVDELPTYKEGMTEDEVKNALKIIFGTRKGVGNNLKNAIEFARTAYKLDGNAEPSRIVAMMLNKFDVKPTLINCYENMAYGSYMKSNSPIMPHVTLYKYLAPLGYNDSQIANITRTFIVSRIESNLRTTLGKFEDDAKPIHELFSKFDEKLINQIVDAAKDSKKSVPVPKIPGLMISEKKFDCAKFVTSIRETYGKDMTDKLVKKKLVEITKYYAPEFKTLETLSK